MIQHKKNHMGRRAVRARRIFTLAGEAPARGFSALDAPLAFLDDGLILAEGEHILAVMPYADYRPEKGDSFFDLGDCSIAPGLVNSHCHLELSHMSGAIPPGLGFEGWLLSLIALDREAEKKGRNLLLPALEEAISSLAACGTALIGDISSRAPESVLGKLRGAGIGGCVFLECIGKSGETMRKFAALAMQEADFSLAGHAFYTTPGEIMREAREWCIAQRRPFSFHLAEHHEEVHCLSIGDGDFCEAMRRHMLPVDWQAPGAHPVAYAASLNLLGPGSLAVHCVCCEKEEVALLAAGGGAICLCPRSNAYIGVGEAPARDFARQGALLCLGTDSLASNADLNLWNEVAYYLEKNTFSPKALLRMATLNGAAALGRDGVYGRLVKGAAFCYTIIPSELDALFC